MIKTRVEVGESGPRGWHLVSSPYMLAWQTSLVHKLGLGTISLGRDECTISGDSDHRMQVRKAKIYRNCSHGCFLIDACSIHHGVH